jgi:4-amino-4-deoxy-L-arabinose transferase
MMVVNRLVFFILLSFWVLKSRKGKSKLLVYGMTPLLLFFVVHFTIPDQTIEVKSPGTFLEQHRQGIADDAIIISDENTIRAVCWYLRRNNVYLLKGAGELAYGLTYKDAGARLLDIRSATDLIDRHRGKTVLIARVKNMERWRDLMPEPVFQDQSGPSGYILWKY